MEPACRNAPAILQQEYVISIHQSQSKHKNVSKPIKNLLTNVFQNIKSVHDMSKPLQKYNKKTNKCVQNGSKNDLWHLFDTFLKEK